MLGIPGETVEDMNETFKFSQTLKADWCQFNIYIACPGSQLYDEVMSKGLYDQMYDYLARVKTDQFDHDMLEKDSEGFSGKLPKICCIQVYAGGKTGRFRHRGKKRARQ